MRTKEQILEQIAQRWNSDNQHKPSTNRAFMLGCAFTLGIDYDDLVNEYFKYAGLIDEAPLHERLRELTNPTPSGMIIEPKE